MASYTEVISFRLLHMEGCCHTLLCWVNPRLPTYCPECGTHCYPQVRGWIMESDTHAVLKVSAKVPVEQLLPERQS